MAAGPLRSAARPLPLPGRLRRRQTKKPATPAQRRHTMTMGTAIAAAGGVAGDADEEHGLVTTWIDQGESTPPERTGFVLPLPLKLTLGRLVHFKGSSASGNEYKGSMQRLSIYTMALVPPAPSHVQVK